MKAAVYGMMAGLLFLAGCGPSLDSEYPAATRAEGKRSDLEPMISLRNTGTYPNINEEPLPSMEQFTPAERNSLTQYMNGLRLEHQRGIISTAEYTKRLEYLRRLAREHSTDTLKKIGAI